MNHGGAGAAVQPDHGTRERDLGGAGGSRRCNVGGRRIRDGVTAGTPPPPHAAIKTAASVAKTTRNTHCISASLRLISACKPATGAWEPCPRFTHANRVCR